MTNVITAHKFRIAVGLVWLWYVVNAKAGVHVPEFQCMFNVH